MFFHDIFRKNQSTGNIGLNHLLRIHSGIEKMIRVFIILYNSSWFHFQEITVTVFLNLKTFLQAENEEVFGVPYKYVNSNERVMLNSYKTTKQDPSSSAITILKYSYIRFENPP